MTAIYGVATFGRLMMASHRINLESHFAHPHILSRSLPHSTPCQLAQVGVLHTFKMIMIGYACFGEIICLCTTGRRIYLSFVFMLNINPIICMHALNNNE